MQEIMGLKDLKSLETIKNTFKKMICEMNVSNLTVNELAKRARIRRKTFYIHFSSIKELFEAVLQEAEDSYFNEIYQSHLSIPMIDVNRVFFSYLAKQDTFTERLFCSESYRGFCCKLFSTTLIHIRNQYNPFASLPKAEQNIVNIFTSQSSIDMYRQWVEDGKKIPLERLIELSSKLVNNGTKSLTRIIL